MDANVTNEKNGKAKKIVDFKVHHLDTIFYDILYNQEIEDPEKKHRQLIEARDIEF